MSESELVQELRKLGGGTNEDRFLVRHNGVGVRVSYTGGSSSRLILHAPFDEVAQATPVAGYRDGQGLSAIRPMKIMLRPEREAERAGKASGIDVEVQTGDPSFDDAVYVDTLTPAEISVQVLGPDARRAILDLFAAEFTAITIDDASGDVIAEIVTFASLEPKAEPGKRAVDAFARLCRALPRVVKAAGEHAKHPLSGWSTFLGIVAFILFTASFPVYFEGTVEDRCNDFATCMGPGIAGVVFGLVVAVVVGIFAAGYTRRFRGRSDSSRVGSSFSITLAAVAFFLAANAVAFVIARM